MTTTEWIAGAASVDDSSENRLPRRVCFSFAAYSKTVLDHLKSSGVHIAAGLSDDEFAAIESSLGFQFPPDLYSILREGLPVGAGFPNWRFASLQQLQVLVSLPASDLLYEISHSLVWPLAWGPRPDSHTESIARAQSLLAGAPKLVPVYRHFYIAATPNLAGNPVFYILGGDVRCCGFDLSDFFCRKELCFLPAAAPSWAATEARRVEVWTDLASGGFITGGGTHGLERLMKALGWRLREGGWEEKEVREMLMMGRSDGVKDGMRDRRTVVMDRLDLMWHVRLQALSLLRSGWSAEDVVYSMGGSRGDATRELVTGDRVCGPHDQRDGDLIN
ncbi:hypothetical protein IEQ34_020722 [Dendrobium chrysotoxum]|uniref:Knr4/Smi1-like domain-containing protein n=1 Tax=Dendrobium chrysotoxum TaxID=161865 RepID=A0AAV7FKM6_DENCH|nr:hypothetical protein IEQ34_020722 [Dendrobium chrysotoxum]